MTLTRKLVAIVATLAIAAALAAASPVDAAREEPVFVEDGLIAGGAGPSVFGPDETVDVIVRLSGPSLLDIHTENQASAATQDVGTMESRTLQTLLQAMERRQVPARAEIEATGAVVLDSYQAIANGFLVTASSSQIREIVEIPGVVSVARAPVLTLDLDSSVRHIGASKVWEDLGYDGTGVNVAVIDTGVDYYHEALGGNGDPAQFLSDDPTVVEEGTFPTAKVVGGYDFVGEFYSAACPSNPQPPIVCTRNPDPDEDPLDYVEGHGTHVSGIIASVGTEGGGVPEGVAPGANIVILKVFGHPEGVNPSTTMSGAAIEWATMHNLDIDVMGTQPEGPIQVINLSLGSDWGGSMVETNRVVEAAVNAGITVIASAGNDTNRPYIAGSPGAAALAVGVGGTHAPGETHMYARIEWQDDGEDKIMEPLALEAHEDWFPQLASLGPISGTLAWYGTACNDDQGNPTPPEQDLQEKIALVERGTCTFYDKIWNAQKMGAIAVLVFTDDRPKVTMSCGAPSTCDIPPGIAAVMIDREPGVTLRDLVYEQQIEVLTTLGADLQADLADKIMDMSSRGPGRYDAVIKPQVVAPGAEITSALAGSGTEGVSWWGTSMSGPHAAGLAALLWQRVNVEGLLLEALDVGALVTNYADPDVKPGNPKYGMPVPVARQGAGRINAYRSVAAHTVVRSDSEIAQLSYGNPRILDDQEVVTRTLTITNFGEEDKDYVPSVRFREPDEDEGRGVSFAFGADPVAVSAGMTEELDVVMTLDPETMGPWEIAGESVIADLGMFRWQEIDGYINLTEANADGEPVEGGDLIGLPFYVLPRRSSCIRQTTEDDFSLAAGGLAADQRWANECGIDGTVEVYHHVASDAAESVDDRTWPTSIDITDVGLRWGSQDESSPNILEWAISTAGTRRIPYDAEFHIYIDSDMDGGFDYAVFNVPQDLGQGYTGRWEVGYAPVLPNSLSIDGANAVFDHLMRYDLDESTSFLPVDAEPLGIDMSDGMALFDWVLVALDLPHDTPRSSSYLGYDLAPDDLENGGAFQFDQTYLGCMELTQDDTPVGGYSQSIVVPAEGEAEVQIGVSDSCPAVEDPVDLSLMMVYPQNRPGDGPGETFTQLRRGTLGTRSIYLPFASRGVELRNAPLDSWLEPRLDSGVKGPAWFMSLEDGVLVNVHLTGTLPASRHPVKILTGGCDEPGEIAYDVGTADNGYLTALLDGVTFDDIALGEHRIVAELSDEDDSIIACGWIPDYTEVPEPTATPMMEEPDVTSEPPDEPGETEEPVPTEEPGATEEPEPTVEPTP